MDDDGMDLNGIETKGLALRLIAHQIEHGNWLEWDDVPMLGEYAFYRLEGAVLAVAEQMIEASEAHDRCNGVDSAAIHERTLG